MFSEEYLKDIAGSSLMKQGDELLCVHQVCLSDKFDNKKDSAFHGDSLICNSSKNDLEGSRSLLRDDLFTEYMEQPQTRFAWTEEDGIIASLVSESGFGTTGQTTFGKELDAELKSEMQSVNTSPSNKGLIFTRKTSVTQQLVSPTSFPTDQQRGRALTGKTSEFKVAKNDPRSRCHYVKYVKRHERTFKLWECGICGREFQHQYTLIRHLPTHTDERNYHCEECGKSFRQLSTLSQHRAIHSAERPYGCEVCKKTFNRVSTLISHRKTHSEEKPYKCHLCSKGFHQKGNLRNHLFTHSNERPYRCNICMKGFNQQSNLVCHKNKSHSENGLITIVSRNTPRIISRRPLKLKQDSGPPVTDFSKEVSSSSETFFTTEGSSSSASWSTTASEGWNIPKTFSSSDFWDPDQMPWSGVFVDRIKTYHMEVALAKKQTPFALLKPEKSSPVLVKVVDMPLTGKQMLVPATAEDLRKGGKIVLKNGQVVSDENVDQALRGEKGEAMQIRVPVVATILPKICPGGKLQLIVEEPHRAYHATLSAGLLTTEPCASSENPLFEAAVVKVESLSSPSHIYNADALREGSPITSSCSLPPPAPSPPPLDLIPLDLLECIPMGPSIIPEDTIGQPPPMDDSDIFIGKDPFI